MRYSQAKCEKVLSDLLIQCGFSVARHPIQNNGYNIAASKSGKTARILAKHLEYDHAYSNSSLPYNVYKIEAFKDEDSKMLGVNAIDFVVGYNFKNDAFACVPIREFSSVRSTVVHEKEGLRHEYYNTWSSLDDFYK